MKRLFLIVLTICMGGMLAQGQQDAQYTQWQWNKLLINPAVAGSAGMMEMTLLGRTQWVGIDGGPRTATFGIHAPIRGKSINLGLSGYIDELGLEQKYGASLDYAYGIPLSIGTLNLGLRAGFEMYNADLQAALIGAANDPAFQMSIENNFNPNFGVGVYYYTEDFWVGASVPHLLNNDLDDVNNLVNSNIAGQTRHYMFTMGHVYPLSSNVKIRPSILGKYVDGTPLEFDINLALKFYEKLWLGVGHRTGDSYDFNIEYLVSNQLRIGYAYDLTTTDLEPFTSGTHEVLLGFNFDFEGKRIVTPRNIQRDF